MNNIGAWFLGFGRAHCSKYGHQGMVPLVKTTISVEGMGIKEWVPSVKTTISVEGMGIKEWVPSVKNTIVLKVWASRNGYHQ